MCLSVKSHLTSGASVRPENTVAYSAGNGGQKICGGFFETAPFKSFGVKGKLKSQLLIRSSPTRDQVFLFDVQRSTSGYCMRQYKHGYCSGQSYSASSSVQSQSHVPFPHSCTRVIGSSTCAFKDSGVTVYLSPVYFIRGIVYTIRRIIYLCIFYPTSGYFIPAW